MKKILFRFFGSKKIHFFSSKIFFVNKKKRGFFFFFCFFFSLFFLSIFLFLFSISFSLFFFFFVCQKKKFIFGRMAASSKSQHLETARSMIEKGEAVFFSFFLSFFPPNSDSFSLSSLSSLSLFSLFPLKTEKKFAWFGSTSKYEEAGECYNKAGNSFKMGKSCLPLFSLPFLSLFKKKK